MLLNFGTWIEVKDGDNDAFLLMSRHYSFRRYRDFRRENKSNPNRRLFIGPGEKIVLVTPCLDALFCWRFFFQFDRTKVLHCSVFRNEGPVLSSSLIIEAEKIAVEKWGRRIAFTYVNTKKVRSTNPGFCFLKAGWCRCGWTKRGLLILSKELA